MTLSHGFTMKPEGRYVVALRNLLSVVRGNKGSRWVDMFFRAWASVSATPSMYWSRGRAVHVNLSISCPC